MLVLVSFGLVLLATILLVVGLLSDDAINLIYLSIAASATAAVVLFLAFRMARPKAATGSTSPAPLPEDLVPAEAVASRHAADTTATMPTTPAAPPTPPAPVPAAAPSGDDWADDTDWEVDEDVVDFPIADYDDLTVAEILPLLPQLYSDELDIVYEREQSGKARSTILSELDKLKQTGTEADALEQAVEEEVEEEVAQPAPSAPQPEPVRTPAPTSLLDEDEDEAAFFPIADYDDLSVSQIVPLLPQLELDELRDVREREVAGANRSTLVSEIDRYLSGELQAFRWDDEEVVAEAAPIVDPEVERLPIANYPQLIVSEVVAQLDGLTPAQLEQVLEFEKARDNRFGIVSDIERRLAEAAPAVPTRPRPAVASRAARKATSKRTARKASTKKRAPKKAATKKSTTRKTGAKKAATTKRTAAKKSTAKKSAKRATRSTKKAAASRFPIANYDELNVADIRPRLTDLTDSQLRQVRDREETGAGRKTILDDIDKRLS